jgi:hypothetical protein
MEVFHYRESKIARAPDELSKAFNAHGKIKSVISSTNKIKAFKELIFWCILKLKEFQRRYNMKIAYNQKIPYIIHYHNKFPVNINQNIYNILKHFYSIIQYHSEPYITCNPQHFANHPLLPKVRLVLNQYHATLPEYKDCFLVKNIINLTNNHIYQNFNLVNHKIVVGFSPSIKDAKNVYYDKGYNETEKILKFLKFKYPTKFDYDIIYKVPLKECILRKSKCNIIIDECKTGSYHRSGLEGLALGKMTICYLNSRVANILKKSTNDDIPFENIHITKLEKFLTSLLNMENAIDIIINKGKKNKIWFFKNWNDLGIINYYYKMYQLASNNNFMPFNIIAEQYNNILNSNFDPIKAALTEINKETINFEDNEKDDMNLTNNIDEKSNLKLSKNMDNLIREKFGSDTIEPNFSDIPQDNLKNKINEIFGTNKKPKTITEFDPSIGKNSLNELNSDNISLINENFSFNTTKDDDNISFVSNNSYKSQKSNYSYVSQSNDSYVSKIINKNNNHNINNNLNHNTNQFDDNNQNNIFNKYYQKSNSIFKHMNTKYSRLPKTMRKK